MEKLTFERYYELIRSGQLMKKKHPDLRLGQCCYNILMSWNKKLALHICATDCDPFYCDDVNDPRFVRFEEAITYTQNDSQ